MSSNSKRPEIRLPLLNPLRKISVNFKGFKRGWFRETTTTESACQTAKSLDVEELTFVDYLHDKQPYINSNMRSHLVDWIISVGTNRKIETVTLCLAVSLFDRYLALKTIGLFEAQLLAASCLLLAARTDDLYADNNITVNDIVDHTWRAGYSTAQIDDMVSSIETTILHGEKQTIVVATAATFLNLYLNVTNGSTATAVDKTIGQLATYIVERSLSDYYIMVICRPDRLAAAALLIARRTLHHTDTPLWPSTLCRVCGFPETDSEMQLAVRKLKPLFDAKLAPTAVRRKYSTAAFGEVAALALK